jgi:hypothetical protein
MVERPTLRKAWNGFARALGVAWLERRMVLLQGGEHAAVPPMDTDRRMRLLVEVGYRLGARSAAELYDWLRRLVPAFGWYSPLEVVSGPLEELVLYRTIVGDGGSS